MKQQEIIENSLDNYSEQFFILALHESFGELVKALRFEFSEQVYDTEIDWGLIYKLFDDEFKLLWKDLKAPSDTVGLIIHKPVYKLFVFFLIVPLVNQKILILIREKEIGKYQSEIEFKVAFKDHISAAITNIFTTFDYTLGFVGLTLMKYEKAKKFIGKSILKVEIAAHKKVLELYDMEIKEKGKSSYSEKAHFIARTELGYEHKSEQDRYYQRFMYYKDNKLE